MVRGVRRSSGPLDARAQAILRAVMRSTGDRRPVGSHTLAGAAPEGVSSATVRNILADLETEGYLGIPTPRGRVPTDVATASTSSLWWGSSRCPRSSS